MDETPKPNSGKVRTGPNCTGDLWHRVLAKHIFVVAIYCYGTYTVGDVRARAEERERRAAHPFAGRDGGPAWLRNQQADRGALEGRAAIQRCVAVSAVIPPRKTGLDTGALG